MKKRVTAKPTHTVPISSSRSRGVTVQSALSRFETYTFKYGCRHGAPEDEVGVINRLPIFDGHEEARNEAIYAVDRKHGGAPANRQDRSMEYAVAVHEAEEKYWKRNSQYIDEPMVKLVFAMAAEEMLDGNNIGKVRRLNTLGMVLREKVKDKDVDDNAIHQAMTKNVYEARTDRGLKIILARNVPCDCLKESKETAKAEPRTRRCEYCKREDVQKSFLKCSRCKVAFYCGKDCQTKHWKNHKLLCNPVSPANLLKKK